MTFALRCGILLLLLAGSLVPAPMTAGHQQTFSHSLTLAAGIGAPREFRTLAAPETLRILAVRVAFKTDNDERTTGTGAFDLSTPARRYPDAPPRNAQYFTDHLTFAHNYFQKVSNGRLVVEGTLLDSVYTLSKTMSAYSPSRTSTTNAEIGSLATETWGLVDSLTPGIPYERYQLFAIFHAGAGHDIDFVSIYGYDPTPFDIPSLYLGMPSLKKIYGDSYQGIPVRHGTYFLQNTMVLPETENREISGIGGTALLKLGINGLVVASIGSHLGLPDLFNTKTGASGIGRFGLMDGQSIFSWNGVFPPEPSAWEKAYLGWVAPVTVAPGSNLYDLPAVSLSNSTDTVYRVPITAKEYFLVENRNRDAHRDGATVTLSVNGATVTKTWARDTSAGFNAFNQDSLYGVVTDVDEFDWSVPGGVITRTNEWFDGGILIWHIDENVIETNLAANAVNADADHRGVNLMEADGSQDIGQSYGLLNAGSGSEEGTQFDFWYAGNQAPLRTGSGNNRFTPTSYPGSRSNSGGNSHIVIRDFSARAPRMSVRIQLGDSLVRPLAGFPKLVGQSGAIQSVKAGQTPAGPAFFIGAGGGLWGWNANGAPLLPGFDSSGALFSSGGPNVHSTAIGSIALAESAAAAEPQIVLIDKTFDTITGQTRVLLHGLRLADANSDRRLDTVYTRSISGASGGPVLHEGLTAWTDSIEVSRANVATGAIIDHINLGDLAVGVTGIDTIAGGQWIALSRNGKLASNQASGTEFGGKYSAPAVAGKISAALGNFVTFASDAGMLHMLGGDLKESARFPMSLGGDVSNSPALADIDGDGTKDVIVFSGNKIWAINPTGAVLANFPITVQQTQKTLLTAPVIGDVDQNGTQDIIAVTQEGLIVAYDRNGKMAAGFPIQSGPNNGSTPAIFSSANPACLACGDTVTLAVASSDGNVYAYRAAAVPAGHPASFPWPQYQHDAQNSGYDGSTTTGTPIAQGFFPAGSAYNWPNPVGRDAGYKTHIRYYLGKDAQVTVKIFDLAGDLVATFDRQGTGGMDNEFEWDVQNIQSGVYFAHINAQGSGESGSAVIKIAVLK